MDFSVRGINGSSAGTGLDLLGAAVNIGDSLYTNYTNKKIAGENIELQRETNAQNEALLRESWARDDNAVQRRVADLKASGLSPLLAAGSAAGNTNPIQLHSPQNIYQRQNVFSEALPAIAAVESIKGQKLDNQLKALQARYYGIPEWAIGIQRILSELPEDNILRKAIMKVGGMLGLTDDEGNFVSPSKSEVDSTPWIRKKGKQTIVNNNWSKEKLESEGVDTTPPSVESHPSDFGITNQSLIQDAAYFIGQMRSDGKLTEQNIKAVANSLAQRYNVRKGDLFDYLMSLSGL